MENISEGENLNLTPKVSLNFGRVSVQKFINFFNLRVDFLYTFLIKECEHNQRFACQNFLSPLFHFTGCGGNFHKRCAMKIPNNCNESRLRSDTNKSTLSLPRKYSDASSVTSTASGETYYSALSETSSQGSSPSPSLGTRRMTWTCGRPVAIDKLVNKLEIPHTFVIHSYKRPTVCNVCRKLVSNSICTG